MHVIAKTGSDDLATVYIAQTKSRKLIEFVESVQPPFPREKKWILIVSTLFGCPAACRMCDAGGSYQGKLSADQIISQIDYLVKRRFPGKNVPVSQFKIQFARMGEPSFNHSVLEVLAELPQRYDAPGLMPSISTIAPGGAEKFFEKLLHIKKQFYASRFQFQFSIHSTDQHERDWLMPVKKWSFEQMSEYGRAFYENGDRKITLNFALADGIKPDPDILLRHFDPEIFLIKITPINPTYQSVKHNLSSVFLHQNRENISSPLRAAGYDVIVSIGEPEENRIGSNCGQFVASHRDGMNQRPEVRDQRSEVGGRLTDLCYTYKIDQI